MIQSSHQWSGKHTTVLFIHDQTNGSDLDAIGGHHLSEILDDCQANHPLEPFEQHSIHLESKPMANRLVLAHVGDGANVSKFRTMVATIVRALKQMERVEWVNMADIPDWECHVSQVIAMVQYHVPHSKQESDRDIAKRNRFYGVNHLIITDNSTMVETGRVVGQSVNMARDFANRPANDLTTSVFVSDIQALFSGDDRYQVTVLDESEMATRNMHALLGVGQGSASPSYLVDISYKPTAGRPIALVGKGVMFDTGGISLKPSKNMKEMKGDMGGAAAVIGAAWATGQLNIDRSVSFIVPLVENMVSASAQRPGDVVVASNGKSIELTNTDAEGRLILADALVYAVQKKVTAVVDIATLTGASIIALGPYAISVLGNNQSVVDQMITHALRYNERCWQLPLFDDYAELLRSDVADCINANEGREAGTITAAKFLEPFVDGMPWCHLDIASTMSVSSTNGEFIKGMTGAGTRSLIAFIQSFNP